MFYDGNLQSGISKALQESKLVACFVTDNGEESSLWEEDFLENSSIKTDLINQTILLRLVAGSAEAGYLSAIFPLPKTPTLVVIKNGQLKEYIAAGVTKDEFLRRLSTVFQSAGAEQPTLDETSTAIQSDVTSPATEEHPLTQPITGNSNRIENDSQSSSALRSQAPSISTTTASAAQSSSLLPSQSNPNPTPENRAQIDAQKKDREVKEKAKEKARQIAKAKAQKAPAEPSISGTAEDGQKTADMKYALMQKKRQQQIKDDRARILKRVEDDKAERRKKEADRKALANATKTSESAPKATALNLTAPPSSPYSKECAIQIRLFDGSTIRSRFPSDGSIRADVRPWIDGQQSTDIPYNFKQVLSPLPNKDISISDEEKSLYSQGLTPSATLILVPVQGYTDAYQGGGSGLVSRGVSAGYGVVSSGVGLVTGVLGSLFGGGVTTPQPPQAEPSSAPPSTNINVRTLRDQDRPEDHQFYNGNALNFEPRNDKDDKKED